MTTKRERKYPRFVQEFPGESQTQQHLGPMTNVNTIIAGVRQTGVDPFAARAASMQFGFASSQSFSEAMQNVAEVQSAFALQPASVRSRFANDPVEWFKATQTPEPPRPDNGPPEASEEAPNPSETASSNQAEAEMDIT